MSPRIKPEFLTPLVDIRHFLLPGSKTFLFFSLAALFFSTACRSPTHRLNWKNPLRSETPHFIVKAESGISAAQLNNTIRRAERIKEKLTKTFFPQSKGLKLNIALFKNRKSYNTFARKLFKNRATVAFYYRRTRSIYIPMNAPDFYWKHELVHALLDQIRPRAPFIIQSGMAWFLQNNKFPDRISCDSKTLARLHPLNLKHRSYLLRYKPILLARGLKLRELSRDIAHHPYLGSFFMLYLWQKEQLMLFLRDYLKNPKQSADYVMTHDDPVAWQKLWKGFVYWLRTEAPKRALPGC